MSAIWEYRELRFHPDTSRSAVRELLTSLAEVERWELDRVRVFRDGRRVVVLRRRTYRLQRTA